MYVIKTDYKTRIDVDLLDKIIKEGDGDGNDVLQAVSKTAEDTIKTLVGVLYDIEPELQKVAAARNGLVLLWALNIATYEVYQRIDDETVPEKVIKNYDDTMEDLIKVSKGQYPLNLPPKPDDPPAGSGEEGAVQDGNGLLRIGTQPKRTHMP